MSVRSKINIAMLAVVYPLLLAGVVLIFGNIFTNESIGAVIIIAMFFVGWPIFSAAGVMVGVQFANGEHPLFGTFVMLVNVVYLLSFLYMTGSVLGVF